jgi:hypothetical protein
MERISLIFSSVTFKGILVIFLVGLITISIVNLVFYINVFKDYTAMYHKIGN